MASYSISEINNILKGELVGNTSQKIKGTEERKRQTAIKSRSLEAINI